MEIEKSVVLAAPIDRVWALLLDPKLMAGCVPGVQSVQVLSDTEYLAEIKVKISFISAKFKIKTTIVETKPPHYLRCEGMGEDSSVASSIKQTSEMFLTEQPDGSTEVRVKSKADVFGRLGSFGLSVMKTKADRMWEEFGANVAAVLRQTSESSGLEAKPSTSSNSATVLVAKAAKTADTQISQTTSHASKGPAAPVDAVKPPKTKWWTRVLSSSSQHSNAMRELRLPTDIYVELHRGNDVVKVLWPSSAPAEIAQWLKEVMGDVRSS